MAGVSGDGTDLAPNIRENFNPRKKWADAMGVIAATRKFQRAGSASGRATPLSSESGSGSDSEGFKTADEDEEAPALTASTTATAATAGSAPSSASASKSTTLANVVGAFRPTKTTSETSGVEDGVRNLSVN